MSENNEIRDLNNKEFVDALRAMVMDENQETRKAMVESLMKAQFLAPITYQDEKEDEETHQRRFSFDALQNPEGDVVFPIYTDAEELRKMKKDGEIHTVVTNMATYAKIFEQQTNIPVKAVVVNPYGMSLKLDKEFFEKNITLANKSKTMQQVKFDKETKFSFRKPQNPRTDMIDALREYLQYREEVKRVYFIEMLIEDPKVPADDKNSKEMHLLLVIDAEGEAEAVFQGIGKIAAPYHEGMNLGMVAYNTDFGQAAIKVTEPFYEKK